LALRFAIVGASGAVGSTLLIASIFFQGSGNYDFQLNWYPRVELPRWHFGHMQHGVANLGSGVAGNPRWPVAIS
jgi:hypothetical protein